MHTAKHFFLKKLASQLRVDGKVVQLNRLYISDKKSSYKYLVDTDADISFIPLHFFKIQYPGLIFLFAANGTHIKPLGERCLKINISFTETLNGCLWLQMLNFEFWVLIFFNHFNLLHSLEIDRLKNFVLWLFMPRYINVDWTM